MGTTSSKIKGCCRNIYCGEEPEHVNDQVQIETAIQAKPANASILGPAAQNQEIIAQHIRTSSKPLPSVTVDNDYLNKLKTLERAAQEAKKLKLKVMGSGGLVPRGTELTITAKGLEGAVRNDGITYFGTNPRPISGPSEEVVDYPLPFKDDSEIDKHVGKHFQIEYSLEKDVYVIKDLGNGFGAFVRLDFPQVLKDNNLLSAGESFIVVNLIEESGLLSDRIAEPAPPSSIAPKLRLKLFSGPSNGEIFYFNPSPEKIRIGRLNVCEIPIEDNSLSKFQATIIYDPVKGWIIQDGYEGRSSTNGTWLYLSEPFEIYDGLVFKTQQITFKAMLV